MALFNIHLVVIVKSVIVLDEVKYSNGTIQNSAEFKVGLSLITFGYYLRLTYKPEYNSLTWTLDYRYSSDFGKIPTANFSVLLRRASLVKKNELFYDLQ